MQLENTYKSNNFRSEFGERVVILDQARLASISKSIDSKNQIQSSLFYTGENQSNGVYLKGEESEQEMNNGKKVRRVIRTKSGRIVKLNHGLVNKDDPSQVSFVEESEWLEKLCEDELEASQQREFKDTEKRKSQGIFFNSTRNCQVQYQNERQKNRNRNPI